MNYVRDYWNALCGSRGVKWGQCSSSGDWIKCHVCGWGKGTTNYMLKQEHLIWQKCLWSKSPRLAIVVTPNFQLWRQFGSFVFKCKYLETINFLKEFCLNILFCLSLTAFQKILNITVGKGSCPWSLNIRNSCSLPYYLNFVAFLPHKLVIELWWQLKYGVCKP
jgi:hypothetical protein